MNKRFLHRSFSFLRILNLYQKKFKLRKEIQELRRREKFEPEKF